MRARKTPEEILSRELITKTDIMALFRIGNKKAEQIFNEVVKSVYDDGKTIIPGRISWRRMYKLLGLPIPQERRK